jgi:thiamine biosynthesis lipoprotein
MTTLTAPIPTARRVEEFECFGSTVAIRASGPEPMLLPAVARARAIAFEVQHRLTRFDSTSELSRLNAHPRERVAASRLLRRFVAAVAPAGQQSGGLVDATCLPAVEAAGYDRHWAAGADFAPRPGRPSSGAWRDVRVEGDTVVRPRGVRLDSGGLGKGLAADVMAEALDGLEAWIVDCGGDLRVGGRAGRERTIQVLDPIDPDVVLHAFGLRHGAVATSGTTRRRWSGGHHLIDPRTGRPADTGVVQVTAVAATGLEAEILAKTALLAGPEHAARALRHGGVVVMASGVVEIRDPRPGEGQSPGALPTLASTGAGRAVEGSSRDSAPAARTNATDAQRQASRPFHW